MHMARVSVFVECRQMQLVYPTAWKEAVLYEQVPFCVPSHASVAVHWHIMLHYSMLESCTACTSKVRIDGMHSLAACECSNCNMGGPDPSSLECMPCHPRVVHI